MSNPGGPTGKNEIYAARMVDLVRSLGEVVEQLRQYSEQLTRQLQIDAVRAADAREGHMNGNGNATGQDDGTPDGGVNGSKSVNKES